MLVLSRRAGERILVGDQVVVTVLWISPGSVRIGIEAPKDMNIVRDELGPCQKIQTDTDDVAEFGRRAGATT